MSDKADAKAKPEATPDAAGAEKKKGGLPVKTIALVLGFLVAEAGTVFALMSMLGKPSDVKATHLEEDHAAEGDKLVEIPVVAEKFVNTSSGRTWVWEIEIIIKVKTRHAGDLSVLDPKAKKAPAGGHGGGHGDAAHAEPATGVAEELKGRQAEIRTGIATIMGAAQHSYFTEPGRETLTRQVLEYLRETVKQDPAGEERVQAVLIPKCFGYLSDF